MSERYRFTGVIESARGGGAVILVPPETATALGGIKQMRVIGTVNGVEHRSSTMPYRGALYLGVHRATREAAGVSVGDEVSVVVSRDESRVSWRSRRRCRRPWPPNLTCAPASRRSRSLGGASSQTPSRRPSAQRRGRSGSTQRSIACASLADRGPRATGTWRIGHSAWAGARTKLTSRGACGGHTRPATDRTSRPRHPGPCAWSVAPAARSGGGGRPAPGCC